MAQQRIIEKPGKLIVAGKRVYEERLRDILEPKQHGRFVAIEPESGRYFLGDSGREAMLAALEAMPDRRFYLARVGYPAAAPLGGYGFRKRLG